MDKIRLRSVKYHENPFHWVHDNPCAHHVEIYIDEALQTQATVFGKFN